MNGVFPVEYPAYLLAGAALGVVYFYAVLRTVRLLVAGAAPSRIIPLYLLRGAGALLVFWLVARHGALALLLTLAGFLAARLVVQRLVRTA